MIWRSPHPPIRWSLPMIWRVLLFGSKTGFPRFGHVPPPNPSGPVSPAPRVVLQVNPSSPAAPGNVQRVRRAGFPRARGRGVPLRTLFRESGRRIGGVSGLAIQCHSWRSHNQKHVINQAITSLPAFHVTPSQPEARSPFSFSTLRPDV